MIISAEDQESEVIVQAKALYKKVGKPEKLLFTDILFHAIYHYAVCMPDKLILASTRDERGWFIFLAVGPGAMSEFFRLAPKPLPYVGFMRSARGREKIVWYKWDRMKRLCEQNNFKLKIG